MAAPDSDGKASFMSLSTELRLRIYEFACQETDTLPWAATHASHQVPSPPLRRVCKTIREEMKSNRRACLLKRNTFIFDHTKDLATYRDVETQRLIKTLVLPKIRHYNANGPSEVKIFSWLIRLLFKRFDRLQHITLRLDSIDAVPGPRDAVWMATSQDIRDKRYDDAFIDLSPGLKVPHDWDTDLKVVCQYHICDDTRKDDPDVVIVSVHYQYLGPSAWKKILAEEHHGEYTVPERVPMANRQRASRTFRIIERYRPPGIKRRSFS